MDWANERYVRLYVRDTTTWKLLPWQSKLLLPAILRKLDRSGILDLGDDGEEGLAAVVEAPVDFIKAGLPELLRRKVFQLVRGKLVMPNYMAAQEAKQSDAQRKRESREKQRVAALASPPVTGCPEPSREVTPSLTEPSLAESSLSSLPASDQARAGSNGDAKAPEPHHWLSYFKAQYHRTKSRQYGQGEADAKALARLGDLMGTTGAEQCAADWESRERIVGEFLASTDARTVQAGWPFAFFAANFRGLALPPEKRPKPPVRAAGNGQRPVVWRSE